jgi:ABC-type uncharacterized transport system permease subunit
MVNAFINGVGAFLIGAINAAGIAILYPDAPHWAVISVALIITSIVFNAWMVIDRLTADE